MNTLGFYNTALLSNMITSWNTWVDSQPGLNSNRRIAPITVENSRFAMPSGNELFVDTFCRADASDVDAERVGISGTFAGMNLARVNATYFQGFGGDRTQILNQRLRMAVTSGGMSENGLMINFVGPEIVKAGGFSVEMQITEIKSSDTQPSDRYVGFGVGLSRAEAAGGADISNPGSFRGRADLTNGVADFFVELDITGSLKVWSKGSLLETVAAGKTKGTLLASFKLNSGFEMGGAVEAHVFLDGVLVDIDSADPDQTSRTFTWDHAEANYVGLSVRATGYR